LRAAADERFVCGPKEDGMDVRRLVDIENGTASREIFVDNDIYRQEQEQIFGRAWLFVGHESQVP